MSEESKRDTSPTQITAVQTGVDYNNLLADLLNGAKKLYGLAIFFSVIAALVFSALARSTYTPLYKTSATFVISVSNSYGQSNKEYDAATAQQMAKTFPYILESGVLSDLIEHDLGVEVLPGDLTASATEEVNLFELSAFASNPQMAYNILKSAIANYPQISDYVIGQTALTLINETGVPNEPSNPINYAVECIKGIVVGLLIFLAAVGIYAVTRSTIHKSDDIRKLLNTKCICNIPKVRRKKRSVNKRDPLLITNQSGNYGFREAYRLLRTRIERMKDKDNKVILVTSALANEGKTTVSVNLAISLAMRGHRVLLIDCDLSNPSVARTLGIKNEITVGLLEYLKGEVEASEIGMKIPKLGNLMVIAGKTRAANPAEMLDNGRIKELIDSMRDYLDYIILDASPSAVLTDSAVLSKFSDASIFVVRQDYSDRDSIIEGVENLALNNLPSLGCVLNMTEFVLSRYSYGYGGYGGYGKKYNNYGKS